MGEINLLSVNYKNILLSFVASKTNVHKYRHFTISTDI
jgi:hypothetical protein